MTMKHLELAPRFQDTSGVLGILDTRKEQLLDLRHAGHVHMLSCRHTSRRPALEEPAGFLLVCFCLDLGGCQVIPAKCVTSAHMQVKSDLNTVCQSKFQGSDWSASAWIWRAAKWSLQSA